MQFWPSIFDVDDISKAAFALLIQDGYEGKSYDMTGPEALTVTEIADRISHVVGKTVRYIPVSPEEKRRSLLAAGISPAFADALDELFGERRKGSESRVDLRTHELFGIHPTTFAEFARKHADVFRGESSLGKQ